MKLTDLFDNLNVLFINISKIKLKKQYNFKDN